MEERITPGTLFIAMSDMYASAGLLIPFLFLLLAAVIALTGGVAEARNFVLIAGLAAIVGFPFAWWRIRNIRATLAQGEAVDGTVTEIRPGRRGSGTTLVKWEYRYEGHLHTGQAHVAVSKDVRPPAKGKRIHLWVNPEKPSWSVWREMYATPLALGKE